MTVYYFQQFVLHPIVFLYLQNLVFVLIIAFTTPSSLLRLAVLPLFLAAAYPVTLSCLEALYRYAWAGFVGGYIIFSLLGYVEIALISKWSFDVKGPTYFPDPGVSPQNSQSNDGLNASSKTWSSSEILERLKFGYLVATNNRNIGTPYIVKNTPSFSSKDPAYIPSRTAFCLRKLLIIISTFLLIDLVSQNPTTLEQNEKLYPADTVRIFTGKPENLKMDQVLTRLVTVLMYWICTAMVIDASTSAIQLVSVALHIKPVKMYRPNFGPIGEAYTIRQFWGVTWHQHLRKHFSAPADLVVYRVLGLKRGALAARYLHLFLVFLISGVLHTWVGVGQGFPWRQQGQIRFFMTQVLGIMLEDAVQGMYRSWRGIERSGETKLGRKLIGYVWVTVFLWWSTPSWIYPRLRLSDGGWKDQVLPFSIAKFMV